MSNLQINPGGSGDNEFSSSEDDDENEINDEEININNVICLFCEENFTGHNLLFEHIKNFHEFDLIAFFKMMQFDCFDFIKFVNYVRLKRLSATDIKNVDRKNWSSDEFMKPTLENDSLLFYDIEGSINVSSIDPLSIAEKRAKLAEELLENVVEDINLMKERVNDLLSNSVNEATMPEIKTLRDNEDSTYIDSYSHFGIHRQMLQDTVRTNAYKDAIFLNCSMISGKTVLDVGCGTGILSLMCAKAGARNVYAVELSDIYYECVNAVIENELEKIITPIKGRMENVELPIDKVDIIISEWMGYFLFFESMLDSVIYARDKYLKSSGILMPNICRLKLSAISNEKFYNKHITFWDDVYGFKMSSMRGHELKEALVDNISPESVVTNEYELLELNLNNCCVSDVEFKSNFSLNFLKDACVHGLCAFFDVDFKLDNPILLSTSPKTEKTHWAQTVFLFKTIINGKVGDVINGTLECMKDKKRPRSLIIKICVGENKQTYYMD